MTAFEFITLKQEEHFKLHGVYADVNRKIAEWCEEYANLPIIVYAFKYCPCIYESAYGTISLHATKKGAEIAMEFHKNEALEDHKRIYGDDEDFEFGQFEHWVVDEVEILT